PTLASGAGGKTLTGLEQIRTAGSRLPDREQFVFPSVAHPSQESEGFLDSSARIRPAINASYSASLLVTSNLNLMAYVNSIPSGFVSMSLSPEPSIQDDPSVNKVQGSGSLSGSVMGSSEDSSSGRSTIKSANICPLIDILGLY
ncbi:hypothetical protein Tco_0419497, partial [Tanacetum coccineum]